MKKTVVVGMSGGVDSSVSALLLKQQGYQVIGLFMKNWDENAHQALIQENKTETLPTVCESAKDYEDVAATCAKIDIPFFSVDFSQEYQKYVFSEFLDDYRQGFTPNPDVLCNKKIKFQVFFEKALSLGADYLATGHYCQIDAEGFLCKGKDKEKDQSYFLNSVNPQILGKVLFPIGHMEKSQVRKIAKDFGLPTKDKKDSTGICFIGERDFRAFLETYIPSKPGPFCLLNGQMVGQHRGAAFYTIGQRRKLGLGGEGNPWFVIKKDIEKNIVFVERDSLHPELYSKGLTAGQLNWFIEKPCIFFATCKIRYRQLDQKCTVKKTKDSQGGDILDVTFEIHQKAVTKGQWLTLYENNRVIGGGRILSTFPV